MFPVNVVNYHWYLGLVDMRNKKLYIYDSMRAVCRATYASFRQVLIYIVSKVCYVNIIGVFVVNRECYYIWSVNMRQIILVLIRRSILLNGVAKFLSNMSVRDKRTIMIVVSLQ